MIVVKIELWPRGSEQHKRLLGQAIIANDGAGTPTHGDYEVVLSRFGGRGTWKKGKLRGFPRKALGPWDIVFRALAGLVGYRNRTGEAEEVIEGVENAERALAVIAPPEWTPTSENVNALPDHLRRYIRDLECRADPAGDIQRIAALEMQNAQLVARLGEEVPHA